MLEPCGEPRLALEVDEEVLAHRALVRNLQRDVQAVNRVDGLVDGRDRAVGDAPLDAVLAEFLSCFERHESAGFSESRSRIGRSLFVVPRSP